MQVKEEYEKTKEEYAEIIDKLNQKEVERGVMALENSIAGSILPNYALIDEHNMQVIGEYNFSIEANKVNKTFLKRNDSVEALIDFDIKIPNFTYFI